MEYIFYIYKKHNRMRNNFLLPKKCKIFGWLILMLSFIGWLYVTISGDSEIDILNTKVYAIIGSELFKDTVYFSVIKSNITYTLIGILFIIGGIQIIFSKEEIEDEFISLLRLKSLKIAFLINYMILIFFYLFVYGLEFLNVLIYNQFTMIIIFIVVFQVLLYRNKIAAK